MKEEGEKKFCDSSANSETTISVLDRDENDTQYLLEPNENKGWLERQDLRILAIYLVNFLLSCAYSIVTPFLPGVAKGKGVSPTWVGIIFSANPAASFICSFAMGKWMRFFGRKKLIILGIFMQIFCASSLGSLIYIENDQVFIGVAVATRFIQGIAINFFSTTCFAIIPVLYPDTVQQKIGSLEATSGLGIMLGPFMGAALYSLVGYEAPFYSFALMYALVIPFTHRALPSDEDLTLIAERQKEAKILKEKAESPDGTSVTESSEKVPLGVLKFLFTRQIFATFLVFCMCSINLAYLSPILANHMESFGVGPSLTGIFFVFGTTGYIIMIKIITGVLVKHLDRKILISMGLSLAILFQLMLGPEPGIFPHLLIINIIGQFLIGPSQALQYIPMIPELISLGRKVYPNDEEGVSDLSSGIFQAGLAFGNMVGPFIGGVLTDNYSFYATARIISLTNVCVLVMYLLFGDALVVLIRKILCKDRKNTAEKLLESEKTAEEETLVKERNMSMQNYASPALEKDYI